jgi:hypothetical protein
VKKGKNPQDSSGDYNIKKSKITEQASEQKAQSPKAQTTQTRTSWRWSNCNCATSPKQQVFRVSKSRVKSLRVKRKLSGTKEERKSRKVLRYICDHYTHTHTHTHTHTPVQEAMEDRGGGHRNY